MSSEREVKRKEEKGENDARHKLRKISGKSEFVSQHICRRSRQTMVAAMAAVIDCAGVGGEAMPFNRPVNVEVECQRRVPAVLKQRQ